MNNFLGNFFKNRIVVLIFRIILVILLVYSVCHCYHNYSMILKGSQEHPDHDFTGYEFNSLDKNYVFKFDNEDTCSLKIYENNSLVMFNRYFYDYEDGTYDLQFYNSYVYYDEKDESITEDLSLVVIEGDTLFLNKYKTYLYVK